VVVIDPETLKGAATDMTMMIKGAREEMMIALAVIMIVTTDETTVEIMVAVTSVAMEELLTEGDHLLAMLRQLTTVMRSQLERLIQKHDLYLCLSLLLALLLVIWVISSKINSVQELSRTLALLLTDCLGARRELATLNLSPSILFLEQLP
jgi:hypothetical protein